MRRMSSENGAVLINVILAIVLLIGINTFVIDYGVMWVGRNQAQNAADAGALAGAIALAYDDFADRTNTGPAKASAWEMSQRNEIWAQAPAVDLTADITFPNVPAAQCADNSCVRVDVYRNAAAGNPLPMLFGTAVGLTNQGVRAMAIARAGAANASDCLKPWAIPDKWTDNHDESGVIDKVWTADDQFELVYPNGKNKGQSLPDKDVYVAPTKDSTGTGFNLTNDLGVQVTLKYGNPQDAAAPGAFLPIDLPLGSGGWTTGGADYRAAIAGCAGVPVTIGTTLPIENGDMKGPTKQGVDDLIALDPDAKWDSTNKKVINSCAQSATPCASRSPRIVAVPVYDTLAYELGKQNGNAVVKIANILGFFIDSISGAGNVTGYFTNVPGLLVGNGPSVGVNSGFAKIVMLVR